MEASQRLRELFSEPGLRWIVDRLVARIRSGRALTGSIRLARPRAEERRATDRLLGRPPGSARALTVSLGSLEIRLRHAGLARDLAQVVDVVVGEVEDHRAVLQAARSRLRGLLEAAASRDPRPEVHQWLASRRTWVLLRRWGREEGTARALLDTALDVLANLPAERRLLQEIALDTTGDAHALDPGRRVATLLLPAVASLGGIDGEGAWRDAMGWRCVWSAVGVLCDELSVPALVLGLPGDEAGDLGRLLELHRRHGEPCRLSLRQLRRCETELEALLARHAGTRAFVCENPSLVLAAAERLGARSAPLVCLEGQPATAARELLDRMIRAGWELAYQGDFDWAGVGIANLMITRHGVEPWRYRAADFRRLPAGPALIGARVEASWDVELASAMAERGRAVHEEALIPELLEDLARAGNRRVG